MQIKNLKYQTESFYFAHTTTGIPDDIMFTTHSHNTYEIYLFLQGSGRYVIEGTTYSLAPYSILMMRPSEFHQLFLDGPCNYERITIEFDESCVIRVDPEKRLLDPFNSHPLGVNNIFLPSTTLGSNIRSYFDAIDRSFSYDDYKKELFINLNFFSILMELSKLRNLNVEPEIYGTDDTPTVVRDIITFVNSNITSPISLDQLSKKFFFSKFYLNKIFKKATGNSIGEYVIKKRLLIAQQLIKTGMTSTNACQASGFGDYSNFYKAYVKFFGVSPKEEKTKKQK